MFDVYSFMIVGLLYTRFSVLCIRVAAVSLKCLVRVDRPRARPPLVLRWYAFKNQTEVSTLIDWLALPCVFSAAVLKGNRNNKTFLQRSRCRWVSDQNGDRSDRRQTKRRHAETATT